MVCKPFFPKAPSHHNFVCYCRGKLLFFLQILELLTGVELLENLVTRLKGKEGKRKQDSK